MTEQQGQSGWQEQAGQGTPPGQANGQVSPLMLPPEWESRRDEAEQIYDDFLLGNGGFLLYRGHPELMPWLEARQEIARKVGVVKAAWEGHYRPGMDLPPDAEPLRAWLDTKYQEQVLGKSHQLAVTDDARRELAAEAREPLVLVPAAGIWDEPDLAWLVDRLIPETGIGTIFGETGTWKSFVALHLLLCVTHGLAFMRRPVMRPGWGIYLLGEGQAGARRRLRAGTADLPVLRGAPGKLAYCKQPFPLADEGATGDFITQAKAMAAGEPVALVVADAAADFYSPGANENLATDMQPLIAGAKRIARELSCFVLLIAHSGYEGGHVRGTSRFGQAWDFEAEANRDKNAKGCGWLQITKVKEDENEFSIPFHVVKASTEPGSPEAAQSLAVRFGRPGDSGGDGDADGMAEPAGQPLPDLTATEERVWTDILAYLAVHASKDKPMQFRRIKDGVKGKEATKRQVLDMLTRVYLVAETTGYGGHPAYFLDREGFAYWACFGTAEEGG